MAHCHWHERPDRHPTLILLHGLEGSSTAHYMRGIADKAWTAGWNVVRLNQRNCGGTEHLSRGLYHSGLTADPIFVLRELIEHDGLPAIAIAGKVPKGVNERVREIVAGRAAQPAVRTRRGMPKRVRR